jgi:hypothetical protein
LKDIFMIKVGDTLPAGTLMELIEVEGNGCSIGPNPVDVAKASAGKTIALFALPGAFTPTCSAKHVPGYVEQHDALKAAGVDEIWCVSVFAASVSRRRDVVVPAQKNKCPRTEHRSAAQRAARRREQPPRRAVTRAAPPSLAPSQKMGSGVPGVAGAREKSVRTSAPDAAAYTPAETRRGASEDTLSAPRRQAASILNTKNLRSELKVERAAGGQRKMHVCCGCSGASGVKKKSNGVTKV